MKRQLAKAVEIGVETLNYWVISYALSSMTMVFRAEWVFVLLAPGDHDHILSGVFNQFLSANPRASRINKKSANNPALID